VTEHRPSAPQPPPASRRGRGRVLALTAFALGSQAAAGCGEPPNPARPKLLNFSDLEKLAVPVTSEATFAEGYGVPEGLRVRDYVTTDGSTYSLTLRNTWTEVYQSAYETAELWLGFDEVWVQPVYVPITGFTNGEPDLLPDSDGSTWAPIFSVGPDSAFYSPFWQTFYFQVPLGSDPDQFKSARKVLDSGISLMPGPAHTMSIVPGTNVSPAQSTPSLKVGGPTGVSSGYLDDQSVNYLDFGKSNFAWTPDLDVVETPLFLLVYRDGLGVLRRMNAPTVAGTGPLYANRPPNVMNDVPHYGAFWRLYTVEVPSTARIFAPDIPAFHDARADFPAEVVGGTYGSSILTDSANDLNQFFGRVAVNGDACFADLNNLDDTAGPTGNPPCQWLDSQPKVEAAVPTTAIGRTDILVTCPFVSYDGMPVVVTP
jgi:hypothetical protein